jgi:putative intracellular protease/amidase
MFSLRFGLKPHIFLRKINISVNMATALAILPPGAEEIEFVASVDVLRRAGVSLIRVYLYLLALKIDVLLLSLFGS